MSNIPLRTISKCHTTATVYEQRNLRELSEEGGITDKRVLTVSCDLTQAPHTHTLRVLPAILNQGLQRRLNDTASSSVSARFCPVILDQHGVVLVLRLFLLSEVIRSSLCQSICLKYTVLLNWNSS